MRRPVMVAAIAAALFTIALSAAPLAGAWSWPSSGPVLQPFRFDPAHPYAAGQHRGVDVGGDAGSAIRAPASGSVTFAGVVPSSGSTLTIATADGYAVTLTHLGSLALAKGASVSEGEVVGVIGPSGDAEVDRPYVHLGVRLAAVEQGYVDPLSLLPPRPAAGGAPPAPSAVAPAAPAPSAAVTPPAAQPAAPPAAAQPAVPSAPQTPAAQPVAAQPAAPEPTPVQPAETQAPAQAPAVTDGAPAARRAAATAADAPFGDMEVAAPARVAAASAPRTSGARLHAAEPHPARSIPHGLSRRARLVSSMPSGPPPVAPPRLRRDPDVNAADVQRATRLIAVRGDGRSGEAVTTAATKSARRSLPLAAGAGVLAILGAAGLAVLARRRRVPIMDRDALLRHNAHLLRQRPPAHRSLVHDHRGGHPHAPSQAARGRDVPAHGRRRARNEGVACR